MKLKALKGVYYKYKNGFAIVFLMFLMVSIVLSSTLERKYELKLGDISQYTIKAPRETQDKFSTDNRIKTAESEVGMQFTQRREVKYEVLDKISSFFDELYELKNYEIIANSMFFDINKNFGVNLSIEDYNSILKLDQSEYLEYKNYLISLINKIYSNYKIEEGNLSILETVRNFVKEEISKTITVEKFKDISINLIIPMIRPNLFYDEEKTLKKKEEVIKNVSPVIIKKDQVIIEEGDLVEESHISILDSLGLLKTSNINWTLNFAIILLVFFVFYIEYYYYKKFYPHIVKNSNDVIVILIVKCIILVFVRILVKDRLIYFVPFAFGPLAITALMNNKISLISNLMTFVLVGIITKFNVVIGLIFLFNIILGTLFLKRLKNRIYFLKVSIWFGLTNVIILVTSTVILGNTKIAIIIDVASSFISAIFSAILVAGVLPMFENVFNIVTSMKLLELINPEHPLLKKLVLEAPGTYNHSLMVANLAEAASESIGANSLLTRVSAYYHDIGKTIKPYFYKENQLGKRNPHDRLDPKTSANIIFSHVKNGVELARKYSLPEFVEHAIEGHHADTLAKYFYITAKNNATNPDSIDEKDFRYGGKLPRTKEVTILMFADSVEAAVRSLVDPTEENIRNTIDAIIKDKISDGQLKNSPISFKDIEVIKESFVKTLKSMYHERIEYPKEENKN